MEDRQLILRGDERIPLPQKVDEEIASAVTGELIQWQALVHVQMMNVRRSGTVTLSAITFQHGNAEMAPAN
jgi:hypothetical protein